MSPHSGTQLSWNSGPWTDYKWEINKKQTIHEYFSDSETNKTPVPFGCCVILMLWRLQMNRIGISNSEEVWRKWLLILKKPRLWKSFNDEKILFNIFMGWGIKQNLPLGKIMNLLHGEKRGWKGHKIRCQFFFF